jgi:GNAT superfamily N-acetyltransferase
MTEKPVIHSPVPLGEGHDVAAFDCGVEALNDYLRKYALLNQQNRSAKTYVAARGRRVVGYYTIAAGSVSREDVPHRIAKGLGRYPVPVFLLARLAVDKDVQGQGLGASLLQDAVLRALQAAEIVGCRAILTHAKDEAAKSFYLRFGFEPSPVNDLHLYLLMKDIQRTLRDMCS